MRDNRSFKRLGIISKGLLCVLCYVENQIVNIYSRFYFTITAIFCARARARVCVYVGEGGVSGCGRSRVCTCVRAHM